MHLNSLIMQDKISKMNDRLEDTRSGCDKIDDTLKRKQLSVNHDKSRQSEIQKQNAENTERKTHEHGVCGNRTLREVEIPWRLDTRKRMQSQH